MEVKTSYRAFIGNYVLASIGALVLFFMYQNGLLFLAFRFSSLADLLMLIFLYVIVATIGVLLEEPAIQRVFTQYFIKNNEVQEVKGIIRKKVTTIPFSAIADVKMWKGVLGRIFNFGNVEVYSIRGEKIVLKGISEPEKVFNLIRSNIQR